MRSRLWNMARLAIAWLGASTAAWTVLLALEPILRRDVRALAGWSFVQVMRDSFLWSLAASVLLAAPHLVLARFRRGARTALALSLALVALAMSYPAWRLACFLASGAWISKQSWAPLFRLGVIAAGGAVALAIWTWHLLVLAPRPSVVARAVPALASVETGRGRLSVLLAGALAATLGFVACGYHFHAYQGMALAVLPALWLVAGTLALWAAKALARPHVLAATGSVVVMLGCAATLADPGSRGGKANLAASRLAYLTDATLTWRGPAFALVDVSDATGFRCEGEGAAARLPPIALPVERRRNVVLISIDTLREDVTRMRVGKRSVMPHLSRLRAASWDMASAQTTYPSTILAVAGALSGHPPARIFYAPGVPENLFTWTRGAVEEQLVSWPGHRWFSLPETRDLYVGDLPVDVGADATAQTTRFIARLKELRRAGRSTLAWIHYFEPHDWYVYRWPTEPFGKTGTALYLNRVRWCDHELGRVVRTLEEEGWLDDTLVIVFADHGESLGEHGYHGHDTYLYQYLTHVPLVVHVPGARPASRDDNVATIDIAPTVLHFLDLEVPPMEGRSLFLPPRGDRAVVMEAIPMPLERLQVLKSQPLLGIEDLERRIEESRPTFASYSPKVAVVQGDWRLIVNRETGAEELFRTSSDPGNARNLVSREPEVRLRLEQELERWHARVSEEVYCAALAVERRAR